MPIFDQGYQHWNGTLSGHSFRWLAIARHGVRIGMKNSLMRIVLLFAWLPAVALGFALAIWGLIEQRSPLVMPLVSWLGFIGPELLSNPKTYRIEVWTICYSYFLNVELQFSMMLILIVGPSLISQDIRFNALPLYFSRPLRRIDYFLGKLGVIGAFLGMVLIVPSLLAYALGLLFSLDISIVLDTLPLLFASVACGAVMALSAGLFILALSSLSRNSRYIGLFWIGIWFITSVVAGILEDTSRNQRVHRNRQTIRAAEWSEVNRGQKMTPQELARQQEARKKAQDELLKKEREASKTEWYPMVSYTGNLERIDRAMLGTDASWQRLSETEPEDSRERFLMKNLGPQYPWYWSATLLVALMGLSACILNFRVKSLDRLK